VVCRRSCLVLATACGNRDVPHAKAACFLVVATIIAVCGRNPLRTFLVPLLATLGIMDGDVEWHLLAAARGHRPAAWGRAMFGCLIVGGVLGGDAVQVIGGVPKNVAWCLEGL
jgi:hypothetical protein